MDHKLFQSPKYGLETEAFRNELVKVFCRRYKLKIKYVLSIDEIKDFICYGLITEETDHLFFQSIYELVMVSQ